LSRPRSQSFPTPKALREKIRVIQADLLDAESLQRIPADLDVAFYLVHSMSASAEQFPAMERQAATNFRMHLEQTSVQQVIYLSGIANDQQLSEHLRSRRNVEQIRRFLYSAYRAPGSHYHRLWQCFIRDYQRSSGKITGHDYAQMVEYEVSTDRDTRC
jgi:hypothetical protein